MSPSATQAWKGDTSVAGANQGDTGAIMYDVVGVTTGDAARALVKATFGVDVGVSFAPSNPNELRICDRVEAHSESPIYFQVTVSFRIPPTGFFQPTVDPLNLPWKYTWRAVVEDEPCDRDFFNNPILNIVGDPPSSPARRTVIKRNLTIERLEKFYDLATYSIYENSVNFDSITLSEPNGNSVTYPPGTIKCTTIKPGAAYTDADAYLPILVDLETYIPHNTDLTQPFQLHLLNQGSRTFYTSTKKGAILDANGNPVNSDVPFAGTGLPMDGALVVQGDSGAVSPIAPTDLPSGSTVEDVATGTPYAVSFLLYQQYNVIPLLPLLTQAAQ